MRSPTCQYSAALCTDLSTLYQFVVECCCRSVSRWSMHPFYIPAIGKGLVSRLDHAAYLGKELARAEQSLLKDGAYVQDAAPELQAPFQVLNEHLTELSACGCGSSCREDKHA